MTHHTLAFIGLDGLTVCFPDALSGPTSREAAMGLQRAIQEGQTPELTIIMDRHEPFLRKFTSALLKRHVRTLVLHAGDTELADIATNTFELPVSLSEMSAYLEIPDGYADAVIEKDGSLSFPTPDDAEEEDDWGLADADDWGLEGESAPDEPIGIEPPLEEAEEAEPDEGRSLELFEADHINHPTTDNHCYTSQPTPRIPEVDDECQTIFSISAKGGVGKTTNAIALAERASERGLKVTLIDANRGQADVSKILRVAGKTATIYDALHHGPKAAHIKPEEINAARSKILPPVDFACIFGPPPEVSDASIVDAGLYNDCLAYAQEVSDLVIVDTQIMEYRDSSGLFDLMTIPSLLSGSWAIGVSGLSSTSVDNMRVNFAHLIDDFGVPRNRLLTYLNAAPEKNAAGKTSLAKAPDFFAQFSTYLGYVPRIEQLETDFNAGLTSELPTQLTSILDKILNITTGLPIPEVEKKKGFFKSLFGGKR